MEFPELTEPELTYDERRAMLMADDKLAQTDWNSDGPRVGGGDIGLCFLLPFFELHAQGAGTGAIYEPAPDWHSFDETTRDAMQRIWRKLWLLSLPSNCGFCSLFLDMFLKPEQAADIPWIDPNLFNADLQNSKPLTDFVDFGLPRDRLGPVRVPDHFNGPDAACIALIDYTWPLYCKYRGRKRLPRTVWL